MNSCRFVRVARGFLVLAVGWVLLSGQVQAQTVRRPQPGTKPSGKPAEQAPARPAPVSPASTELPPLAAPVPHDPPEVADALPSPIRPAAPDLALRVEDEKRADAFAAFALGVVAEENADQEKMLESYRKALELDPGNPELAVKVAYELARRNDPSAAIQVLKDAIKASPKAALPCIYLSQLYAKNLNKPELAMKYAEQALALEPDSFSALQAVYELYSSNGQEKKAAELLDKATKSPSTSGKYWIQLAEMEQNLWLKEEGSADAAQTEKMNAAFRKAAEYGKEDVVVLTKAADYFRLSKQCKAAIPLYVAALGLDPEAKGIPVNNIRDRLSQCFLLTEQRDEAIKQLEAVVKESPLRLETYELLGQLYLEKEDVEKALTNFEHGLRLDGGDPGTYHRLGSLLLRTKRYDRAVDILRAAQKKYSDQAMFSYMLGIALSQTKRHDEALTAFSDAQALAEVKTQDMLDADFYFSFGAAAEQAGRVDKAVSLLKRSIELEPNNAQAFNYLGYMWADRNERLDEAGELINKALAIEPENSAYLDSLGWYFYRKGDFERALKEILKAQAIMQREEQKDDATVLDHLAETYLKLGKTSDAVTAWQKSLTLEKSKKIEEKIEAAKQKLTKGNDTPAPVEPVPAPEK
jgi:tetratricopeptide (TPR) repeat protein